MKQFDPPFGPSCVPVYQQFQVTLSLLFGSSPDRGSVGSYGSLNRSKTTAWFDLNVDATDDQNAGE